MKTNYKVSSQRAALTKAMLDGMVSRMIAKTAVVIAAPKRGPRGSICLLIRFPFQFRFSLALIQLQPLDGLQD